MEFTTSLLIESWILYALGVFIVACRFVARRMKLGAWKKLQIDDYLMFFALINFTGVVFSINEVAKNGSNYMAPEIAAALTPEGVKQAVYGSIMTFVLEIFTLTGTWTVKICLLILYSRIARGANTFQTVLLKIASGYVVLTYFVVMFMFIFFWCNPTYEYWAVPVRIMQCATYYHHMIFATACNISSDLLLFFIPIPLIVNLKMPTKKKAILVGILGLGVFNILAAVLNRYYNFSNPNSYVFLYWYVAEVGIAMYVGNLPLCWPLLRRVLGQKDESIPSYPVRSSSYFRKPSHPSTTTTSGWDKLTEIDTRTAYDQADGRESAAGKHMELIEVKPHNENAEMAEDHIGLALSNEEMRNDNRDSRLRSERIQVTTTVQFSSTSRNA